MADTKQYDFIEQFKDDLNKIKKGIDPTQQILKPFKQDLLPIKYAFKLTRKGFDPDFLAETIQDIGYKRSKRLRKDHLKSVKTTYEQFWKKNIQPKSSPPQWIKGTDPKKEYGILANELNGIFVKTEGTMRTVWKETIKKIVKGKKHKGDVKLQAGKHAVMPPLAIAGGVLAVAGTILTLGIAIPLTAILFHKSAVALKGSYDFASGRYRSTKKLEEKIIGTVDRLEKSHDKYIKENDPAKKKKAHKDIGDKETWANFLETFFAVHKKSMDHLDQLLGKYEKKIREHYADLVHLAKKTGRHNYATEKMKSATHEYNVKLLKYNSDLPPGELLKLSDLDALLKKTGKLMKLIKKNEDAIPKVQALIKKLSKDISAQESDLKKWSGQLDAFKKARPPSVKRWKAAFKTISILEDLAAVALGSGGGNTTDAVKQFQGVGQKISEDGSLIVTVADEIRDKTQATVKELKNQISKHKKSEQKTAA